MAEITISALAENIFKAKDQIAKEPCGFIQSVIINSGTDGVSADGTGTVTSFATAEPTLNTSYTPAMTIPEGDAQTVSVKTMTVGQVANVKIPLTGELTKKLDNTAGRDAVVQAMFAQGFRKIRNTIEAHCGTIIYKGASRAYGTAGTSPFATNINPLAQLNKIHTDNGSPQDDERSLIINTTAGANLRELSNLYKVNEAGDSGLLRRGELGNLYKFSIKESAGVATTTAGTMANATSSSAAFTVGQTAIPLATAGTGLVSAGDVITFANDTNKYVVSAVSFAGANPASGDTITLAAPGLRVAQGVATRAITVVAAYSANVGFHKSAVELVVRPPAQPYGGDAAVDRMTFVDDVVGLVYEVAQYKGYGKSMFDITTFYQAKVWKPEFVATLLG